MLITTTTTSIVVVLLYYYITTAADFAINSVESSDVSTGRNGSRNAVIVTVI